MQNHIRHSSDMRIPSYESNAFNITPDITKVMFLPASQMDRSMNGFNMTGSFVKGEDIIKRNKKNIKILNAYNKEMQEI